MESAPKKGQNLLAELRHARRSNGLSREGLAARIGVEAQVIKRLEHGVGSVRVLEAAMAAVDFRLTGIGPGRSVAEQLRRLRLRKAMSVAEVARRTGLNRATIADVERGGGTVSSLLRLLNVLVPQARRRAPERAYWGQGDKEDRDSRFTSPAFMASIYAAFGEIDLDPCGHLLSSVVAHRRILLSEGGDGLTDDWSGRVAFVNPPFSALLRWLRRAHEQWQVGNVETVVCLGPVRTDSAWFHETLSPVADIFLLQGRPPFIDTKGRSQHTPFPLMLLTLGATAEQRTRFAASVPGYWLARNTSANAVQTVDTAVTMPSA